MTTPEYIRHVQRNHADTPNQSWCGQPCHRFELPFIDIDHSVFTRLAEGRLEICPDCKKSIIEAINS